MKDSSSKQTPRVKRRTLLTTVGASAVAGCNSNQEAESTDESEPSEPDEPETSESEQGDCIDRSRYEELQDRYEDLQERHEELQSRYRDLEQQALLPPYIENDRRKSIVKFKNTIGEIETWEWDSSVVEAQITEGSLVRRLTYSQLEYYDLDQFGFQGSSKYQQLGDFGQYYQLNPFIIPGNFDPMAEKFYNRHNSDQNRIREAWNFVTQINDYVAEIRETPRFPLETLLFGGGDCEDSCIILGSILYNMPSITPSFWFIDADNPKEIQEINHVIIGVETSQGEYLIETTSSDTMLPYNEVEGFQVKIEQ